MYAITFSFLAVLSALLGAWWFVPVFGVLALAFTPKQYRSWTAWVVAGIVILSIFWHPAREMFWTGALPKAVQVHIVGRVMLPFAMTTLNPNQKVDECLPRGTWIFLGVETKNPMYRFSSGRKDGWLDFGFFEKGGTGGNQFSLPLQEDDRYGSLLVSTDTTRNIPTGHEVIVSQECGAITVTPNVQGEGREFTLVPSPQNVSLIFSRP